MPVPGRKPKDPARRRNRVQPRHEWTDVPNVRFEDAPRLPKWSARFKPLDWKEKQPTTWPAATLRWWHTISTMPHCALWEDAEWQFATDTALLVAAYHCGALRWAAEIRTREKVMGTTADARRDLRIRYTDPDSGTEADPADTASVTAMADYQRMVDDEG